MQKLEFREATIEDSDLLLAWANEHEVRKQAFYSSQISHDRHIDWLKGKLNNSDSLIHIAMLDGMPVGQVRIDLDKSAQQGLIDYSIDKVCRGIGLGTSLLVHAINVAKASKKAACLKGVVKTGNVASIRAFQKAGFTTSSTFNETVEFIFPVTNP